MSFVALGGQDQYFVADYARDESEHQLQLKLSYNRSLIQLGVNDIKYSIKY